MMRIYALFFTCCAVSANAAEPIERLFFSSAERTKMDRVRERFGRSPGIEYSAPMMDGMVQRGDGRNTIWINGRPFDADDSQTNFASTLPSNSEILGRVIEKRRTAVKRPDRKVSPKPPG
jgi:hypothetical protein